MICLSQTSVENTLVCRQLTAVSTVGELEHYFESIVHNGSIYTLVIRCVYCKYKGSHITSYFLSYEETILSQSRNKIWQTNS